MKYIINFTKHISFVGWVLYLIKFIVEDYMPDKLFCFIMVIIFAIIFYLFSDINRIKYDKNKNKIKIVIILGGNIKYIYEV